MVHPSQFDSKPSFMITFIPDFYDNTARHSEPVERERGQHHALHPPDHPHGFKKICKGWKFQSMVLGMLYMSKTGLRISIV